MYLSDATPDLAGVAAVLKAAAEPSRLRILKALRDGELCACHLVELLGLAQPTVSRHLTVLRAAGLVRERKDGRWSYYRLGGHDGLRRRVLRLVADFPGEDPVVAEDRLRAAEMRGLPAGEACAGRTR